LIALPPGDIKLKGDVVRDSGVR